VLYSCSKNRDDKTGQISQSGNGNIEKSDLNSAGVKESGIEFNVQYEQPRRIFRIDKEDLNNDGNNEIIVTSVVKDPDERFSDYYNFDMLEVFALNSDKSSYVKISSDTVYYSEDCIFADLGNDEKKQMLVMTNSGGNEVITSKGMFVFDMTSGDKISLLKYFDTGNPVIADVKNDGNKEILISDLFYGVMPQLNAIVYVKQIYMLEGQELVEKNSEFKVFYDSVIAKTLEEYYGTRRKVEMGMQPGNMSYPLYREAAEVIVNYYAKGDEINLKKFWDEQKEFLKNNIPEAEFVDLYNFVLKALPSAKNA
jgi:hypothetical protein